MRLLQLNLNHCEAAQDLLSQTIAELKVDVAILSEPYRERSANWTQDVCKKAAIWSCGRHPLHLESIAKERSFVCGKISDIFIYSCYIPPSTPLDEFEETVGKIAMDAMLRQRYIIAGDFNAWAMEWGSQRTTPKGRALLEAFACLDIVLLNSGGEHTFFRNGFGSIIDITFVSANIYRESKWKLSECYTQSDHSAIICDIDLNECKRQKQQLILKHRGWKTGTLDLAIFKEMLPTSEYTGCANDMATKIMGDIRKACDASMSRKTTANKHVPVYWWNECIHSFRKECIKARRSFQRARGRPNFLEARETYKTARRQLKTAIKESKRKSFLELCDDAENNPWGTAYKVVTKKLKSAKESIPTCPIFLNEVVNTLFPKQRKLVSLTSKPIAHQFPRISADEVLQAVNRIEDNKSPGPDGVPNQVLKLAFAQATSNFVRLFNTCLAEGTFPSIWKRQRLVLLPKPGKPPMEPSSFRPICLLDSAGKVLERIIYNRLENEIDSARGISDNQFGFRKGRSTVDAVNTAKKIAQQAISGTRWLEGAKEYCLIVTLDVRNAFNTANWAKILDALDEIGVSPYLRAMIRSYFEDRVLDYDTAVGRKCYKVSGGVPQGSVLGPLLWNIMYDGVLRLNIPNGANIIGFADDIAVVITAKRLSDICEKANRTIACVNSWLVQNGLQLAEQKTESVLISSRKKIEVATIQVGNHRITTVPEVKYLGIMIDRRLSFKTHLEYATKKASSTVAALSRIMLNARGPKQRRRQLLAGVVKNQILYGAPVWHMATQHPSYFRGIKAAYRLCALRVCSAFKTVSEEAALVIAGMYPIEILANEAAVLADSETQRIVAREASTQNWQQKWNNTTKGRWTHRCIPDVRSWIDRKHGEVDFYLTQFLTGHGCFKAYLHRFNHESDAVCDYCGVNAIEDVHHVFFECKRFYGSRSKLRRIFGGKYDPDTFVQSMLQSREKWTAACDVIAETMKKLRTLERLRRRTGD